MYYLDEKTSLLIQRLLVYTTPQTISQIAKDLGVHRRVVYYHLDKINDILQEQNIDAIHNEKNKGVYLTIVQRETLDHVMTSHKIMYVLNTDERQLYFMFYIAMAKQRVTIDKMIEVSAMSRNTVLSDIAMIRKYLKDSSYRIELSATKNKGYHYIGKNMDVIHFLYGLLNQIFQSENAVFLQQIASLLLINEDAKLLLSDDFSKELYSIVHQQTETLKKTFVSKDLQHALQLFPYFILALKNISDLTITVDLKEVAERLEYPIAKYTMMHLGDMFDMTFSIEDIYFLTLMLLSIRKEYDGHVSSTDYIHLHRSLMRFIVLFEHEARVELDEKEELCNRLVMHFKSLLYRKKYNVFTYNPLTNMIKTQYEDLFHIVVKCSQILEQDLHVQLSEEDIAYIAIHFGGALRHQQKNVSYNKIVILTDESKSIQHLLIEQCERYLSRVKIVGVLSRREELTQYDDFDMVVTTLKQVVHDKPVVQVSPIFQFKDILNLFRHSGQNRQQSQRFWNQIDEALAQYVPNKEDRAELNKSLNRIFDNIL